MSVDGFGGHVEFGGVRIPVESWTYETAATTDSATGDYVVPECPKTISVNTTGCFPMSFAISAGSNEEFERKLRRYFLGRARITPNDWYGYIPSWMLNLGIGWI